MYNLKYEIYSIGNSPNINHIIITFLIIEESITDDT